MALTSCIYASPLGELQALFSDHGLCLLEFSDTHLLEREVAQVEAARGGPAVPGENDLTRQLGTELDEYFSGRRRTFDVPVDMVGTTFQKSVWQALLEIPYGRTWSYAHEASHIGRPTAVRAVAGANGNNKISIVIPCHRVIGSNGSLTGYGGGLPRKKWLLALESAEPQQSLPAAA